MRSRILIPLAATAALAVGVTGAIAGARFAEPRVELAEAPTVEVSVLAPVDESAGTLAEAMAEAGGELLVSPTVGTRTVPEPGSISEDAVSRGRESYLDALEAAADPAEVPPPAAGAAGDPCADGGEGCPPGIGGTVLPIGGEIPPLQLHATGERGEQCPAAGDDRADEPGAIRFWVRANAPVIYSAYASDGTHRDVTNFRVTPEQEEAWLAEFVTAGEAWIESCIALDGFDAEYALNVHIMATRIGSSDIARRVVHVTQDDGLAEPPTRIHSVGNTTVFVAAPHTPGERVQLLVLDDTAGDGCRYGPAADGRMLPATREPRTLEVSAEELAANGWEPEYTRRTTATFAVPSGASVIACVGWFPARGGESWDTDRPIRVSELPILTPSLSAPVVTVDELELTEHLADGALRLRGATEDGVRCGSLRLRSGALGGELCDLGALLGRDAVSGAFLLTTEVDVAEGAAVNHALLDISLRDCTEGCARATRVFDVPLSTQIRPSRICSDDCTVNRGETVGMVRIRATWPEVAASGEGWAFGDWYEGATRVERDPLPRMDTTGTVHLDAIDADSRSQDAVSALRVDRPVTATVEAEPAETRIEGICPRPGGTLMWTSATPAASHSVRLENLCLGAVYYLTVTLTDAEGGTSVYSLDRFGTRFWPSGRLDTGALLSTVVIDRLSLVNPDPASAVNLQSLEVRVGYGDARVNLPAASQRCWVGDIHGISSGITGLRLGEAISVIVDARIRPAEAPPGLTTPVYPASTCDVDHSRPTERVRMYGWISYEQYLAGARITVNDPDTGESAVVELSDDLES